MHCALTLKGAPGTTSSWSNITGCGYDDVMAVVKCLGVRRFGCLVL
jgi:hypothetical protein